MKLAVAIAAENAAPDAFVVWRGIEESIRKAAAAGYHGVELALRDAQQVDPERFADLLNQSELTCPCISTGQVFASSGLYFTAQNSSVRSRVIRVFRELIDLAARFGAMVNIGRARGFIEEGEFPEDAEKRFIRTAGEVADYAADKGVVLILEPVNRYEINFVNSLAQGADLLEKLGRDNVRLMPDLFHMNIEDPAPEKELTRWISWIAYIHFADSNRLAPGRGHIDFHAIATALANAGYTGWGSVEDIAVMRAIPNMTVICPSDITETRMALRAIIELSGPAFLRLSRENISSDYGEDHPFEIGKAVRLTKGRDVTLIATGPMVAMARKAALHLAKKDISAELIDMHTVKPLDSKAVCESAAKTGAIVTIEEHSIHGGLGSAVCESVCAACPVPVLRVGIEDRFGETGSYGDILNRAGLSAEKIVRAAESVIEMKSKSFSEAIS